MDLPRHHLPTYLGMHAQVAVCCARLQASHAVHWQTVAGNLQYMMYGNGRQIRQIMLRIIIIIIIIIMHDRPKPVCLTLTG
jgi:hypothetical protein